MASLRIGIVGTSHWTERVHGAGAAAHPDWELVTVWGRSAEKAKAIADKLGCGWTTEYDEMLAGVDAVGFAVPPVVQAELALRAAEAGKHLLLEKPLAVDVVSAENLVAAIDAAGVANVVFFTRLWAPATVAWLEQLREQGGWEAGRVSQIASLPEAFLAASPWRREFGALWDVGPHVLSVLERVLGPVSRIAAMAGVRDQVEFALQHESGASSSASLTLTAAPDANHSEGHFWGQAGRSGPMQPTDPEVLKVSAQLAVAAALTSLAEQVRTGARGPDITGGADAHYGLHVVRVLAAAQVALATGAAQHVE